MKHLSAYLVSAPTVVAKPRGCSNSLIRENEYSQEAWMALEKYLGAELHFDDFCLLQETVSEEKPWTVLGAKTKKLNLPPPV